MHYCVILALKSRTNFRRLVRLPIKQQKGGFRVKDSFLGVKHTGYKALCNTGRPLSVTGKYRGKVHDAASHAVRGSIGMPVPFDVLQTQRYHQDPSISPVILFCFSETNIVLIHMSPFHLNVPVSHREPTPKSRSMHVAVSAKCTYSMWKKCKVYSHSGIYYGTV